MVCQAMIGKLCAVSAKTISPPRNFARQSSDEPERRLTIATQIQEIPANCIQTTSLEIQNVQAPPKITSGACKSGEKKGRRIMKSRCGTSPSRSLRL